MTMKGIDMSFGWFTRDRKGRAQGSNSDDSSILSSRRGFVSANRGRAALAAASLAAVGALLVSPAAGLLGGTAHPASTGEAGLGAGLKASPASVTGRARRPLRRR